MSDDKDLSLIERAVGRMSAPPKLPSAASPPKVKSAASAPLSPPSATPESAPESLEWRAEADTASPEISTQSTPSPVSAPRGPRDREEPRIFTFDLERLKAEGLLTPNPGRSQLAEEYRMIKRPLLMNAFGKGSELVPDGNMVMVTSTYPGEGKSFTTVNLAMSITQEMDKTVLLVDADVGRSRFHRMLGTPDTPGLLDLLLDDDLDPSDAIIRTSIPNLRILPKGRPHPQATELLASDAMARLTRELANRYPDRMVIFDSPPLLITSESVVLSSHMGQIVFVVESEKTSQGAVKEALALLDDSKPIGLVLNKTRKTITSDYYGYGNYGYGNYHPAEGTTT